jgi:epoxyqueuosine reductase
MIDPELRPLIGNRIFGCDDCLAVCPWNKYARAASEPDFVPRAELTAPRLAALARLNDAEFRKMFTRTSVKRIGRDRFLRNVLIAIGNSGDASLTETVRRCLDDSAPLVRAAAVWAFTRLVGGEAVAEADRRLLGETEPMVRDEWMRLGGRVAVVAT